MLWTSPRRFAQLKTNHLCWAITTELCWSWAWLWLRIPESIPQPFLPAYTGRWWAAVQMLMVSGRPWLLLGWCGAGFLWLQATSQQNGFTCLSVLHYWKHSVEFEFWQLQTFLLNTSINSLLIIKKCSFECIVSVWCALPERSCLMRPLLVLMSTGRKSLNQ